MFGKLLSVLVLLALIASVEAEVLDVPDDYETIQGAINAARNGDEVRVAEGEYTENVDFDGKGITLTGDPEDPSTRIIDGDEDGSVVVFNSNEMRGSIIEGFTLRNGRAEGHGGGGIYCNGTRPEIRNLIIEECTGDRGGGILCWGGSPLINDVVVRNCTAAGHGGGICFSENANPILNRAEVYENRSENNGGGIASYSRGEPLLADVIVRDNSARAHGGGIYILTLSELTNVTIFRNSAGGHGGGVYASGNADFENCVIDSNSSANCGGGLCFDSGRPVFDRVQITNNSAGELGGGMIFAGADPQMNFITVSGNIAEDNGGALYLSDRAEVVISNSITWNNTPQEIYFHDRDNTITIDYCDIEGGQDEIEANDGDVNWGEGNIDSDPLFAGPEEGDFHLTWENYPEEETKSPCIDAADPDEEPDTDETRADMGAYPFLQMFPEIVVEPEAVDFGGVLVDQSEDVNVVFRNSGRAELSVTSITLEQEDDLFSIVEGGEAVEIEVDGEHVLRLRFAPENVGDQVAQVVIECNDPENERLDIEVSGYGNFAPRVIGSIPDIVIREDSEWQEVADLDTIFSDSEGEQLGFEISNAAEEIFFWINNDSILSVSAEDNFFTENPQEITLTARDPFDETESLSFNVTVRPVNDPPTAFHLIAPRDRTILEESIVTFDWSSSSDVDSEDFFYLFSLDFETGEIDTTLTWEVNHRQSLKVLNLAVIRESFNIVNDFTATWWVEARDEEFIVESDERWSVVIPYNSVNEWWSTPPTEFRLGQNHPNPFNAFTRIPFSVPRPAFVSLDIYNLSGRLVLNLVADDLNIGNYEIDWNAGGVESGVYLLEMKSGGFRSLRRVVLIK